jgi:hypothetical protein
VTSALDVAKLHLRTLYRFDDRGRMVAETVEEGREAPRFVFVRTREGDLWRVRHDVTEDVAERLASIVADEPALSEVDRAPSFEGAYTEAFAPVARTGGGPFYAFPADLGPDARVVEMTSADVDLIPAELGGPDGIADGADLPCFAVVEEGRAVSVCRTARLVDGAAQAGVGTLEAYRRRGHGARAVRVWGRAIRKTRREPIYSTSYSNAASRALARSAGLTLMGADYNVY